MTLNGSLILSAQIKDLLLHVFYDDVPIRKEYVVKGQESSYPQALIRQGSGQISQFSLSSRNQSELSLIIPMIKKLEKNSLLLL